jgi:hypothetical protein
MKFAVEALEHESSMHDNAKRLYNFLNKNIWTKWEHINN